MWKLGLSIVSMLLNLFGFGKKDERDIERAAGEKLGRAETSNEVNANAISEVTKAVQARDANDSDLRDDPDRLRSGTDPAARGYSGPKPD